MKIPPASLLQHTAILGRTGSGKTFAAKGIVEGWLSASRRVCVLDPTGAWHGLRSSSDGLSPGFPVVVFGGDHADVPITEHAGGALGELIATTQLSAVIDLSDTTLGARHRFVERFAESLFRANRQPLHLVIDEADEFAPQSGAPGTERMLGAIDRIVRRGRIKGFRVMMITQRPAVLNKNVLTQAGTLIAMRLPSSQDRKAVELWVKGQADESQAGKMMASLAGLQRGEGWVWAPESNFLDRMKFPAITTFDSSRTPEDGEAPAQPTTLADVDLTSVRAALAEATAEAEANDVGKLRSRIKELEKQLGDERAKPVTIHADKRVRELEAANANYSIAHNAAVSELNTIFDHVQRGLQRIADWDMKGGSSNEDRSDATDSVVRHVRAVSDTCPSDPRTDANIGDEVAGLAQVREVRAGVRQVREGSVGGLQLTGPQQKLIDAVAWWNAAGITSPTRVQVAHVAGYTPSGGTWRNLMSECRALGLIAYDGDLLDLDTAGVSAANRPAAPASSAELHARVFEKLTGPQRKVIGLLTVHGTREMGRSHVAELCGYQATGGTWRNLLSELRSLQLITYPKKTTIAAASWLFPGAAR